MADGKLPPDFYVAVLPIVIVFLAWFTSPFWANAAVGQVVWNVALLAAGAGSVCIMDTADIRVEHMELLDDWRDEAIREGHRGRKNLDRGARFRHKSLTKTCLGCHTDREAFCDRCHEYVDKDPYCWDCHVNSGKAPRPGPAGPAKAPSKRRERGER